MTSDHGLMSQIVSLMIVLPLAISIPCYSDIANKRLVDKVVITGVLITGESGREYRERGVPCLASQCDFGLYLFTFRLQ